MHSIKDYEKLFKKYGILALGIIPSYAAEYILRKYIKMWQGNEVFESGFDKVLFKVENPDKKTIFQALLLFKRMPKAYLFAHFEKDGEQYYMLTRNFKEAKQLIHCKVFRLEVGTYDNT